METKQALLVAVVGTMLMGSVSAYPMGDLIPTSACRDMKPRSAVGVEGMEGHLLLAQNDMPGKKRMLPYYINADSPAKNYHPSQQIKVTVSANQTKGIMYYKGILLQARQVLCASNDTIMVDENPLGSWQVISEPGNPVHLLATMDCTGTNSKSAVRHRTPALKIRETVTWQAPETSVGHVTFWATIVNEGNTHWTGVASRILLDPDGGTPPKCGVGMLNASLSVTTSAALLVFLYVSVLRSH